VAFCYVRIIETIQNERDGWVISLDKWSYQKILASNLDFTYICGLNWRLCDYSGTDSVTRFPFSILTNRNRLSLKIIVISIGSSSTSNNSWPLIPSNLVIIIMVIRLAAVFRLCCFNQFSHLGSFISN
jgi:hypothetical protein